MHARIANLFYIRGWSDGAKSSMDIIKITEGEKPHRCPSFALVKISLS